MAELVYASDLESEGYFIHMGSNPFSRINFLLFTPRPGVEPGTLGLTVHCSTYWAIEDKNLYF